VKHKTLLSKKEIGLQRQEREHLQGDIQEKLGVAEINKARRRLCAKCNAYTPAKEGEKRKCKYSLLPLTSDGADCSYYPNALGL